jgi:hypothetical protein
VGFQKNDFQHLGAVNSKIGFIMRIADIIPKHKMAKPFCVFKTLTGFGF